MSPDKTEPVHSSPSSSDDGMLPQKPVASFHYDPDVFAQLQTYLRTRNHHGLALVARQKGLPPFLRFKVWSVLLKHHPFVLNPFIQPDLMDKDKLSSDSDSEDPGAQLKHRVRKDLRKYMHRIAYSSAEEPLSQTELQLFDILENSVCKFVGKWGRVIKYDLALTWVALGLAEWFPPIPQTSWVLLGRDVSSSEHTCIGSLFHDYESFIESVPDLRDFLDEMVADETIANLKFHEVFERLVLVLLHSPENANKRVAQDKVLKIDKSTLPVNGGTIEERVSFFIHVFQKLLPELSQYFQEEQILNKFGLHDDEWVLWWLKYCGSKVWSRVDRGRVWDMVLGWRPYNKKAEAGHYARRLQILDDLLDKLGPDTFWSVDYDEDEAAVLHEDDSLRDLIAEVHIDGSRSSSATSSNPLPTLPSLSVSEGENGVAHFATRSEIPFCKLDPHIELLFISLSLLKAKENTLVELDQHEIRTFLSRLPAKSYKRSDKYKEYQEKKDKRNGAIYSDHGLRYDYMDSVIYEAGELWRKWLWLELNGSN